MVLESGLGLAVSSKNPKYYISCNKTHFCHVGTLKLECVIQLDGVSVYLAVVSS